MANEDYGRILDKLRAFDALFGEDWSLGKEMVGPVWSRIREIVAEEIEHPGRRNIALAVLSQYSDDLDDMAGCILAIKTGNDSYFAW